MAKALLKSRGYEVEERMIGEGQAWSKKDLLQAVPEARQVPQIFIEDKYIGSYTQLKDYFYTS
jgi:glutaredoxin